MAHNVPLLFHSPRSRSSGTLMLLEELGCEYEVARVHLTDGAQRSTDFLTVNPLGKVPAISHDGTLVTEQPAIFIYLADAFPERGLAPPIGNPDRGAYLRWLAFYGGSFEPAVIDRAMKREPGPIAMSPYGSYEAVIGAVEAQLATGPWLLGNRFTAADVLWGMALTWTTGSGLVERTPAIAAYLDRFAARPSFAAVQVKDAAMIEQGSAAPPA